MARNEEQTDAEPHIRRVTLSVISKPPLREASFHPA